MGINNLPEKVVTVLKKYKYVLLVIIIGILLMTIPFSTKTDDQQLPQKVQTEAPGMEDRLIKILSQIQGAGKVSVMLTESAGEETIYQTDQNISVSDSNSTTQKDTVTITDDKRSENGLIIQVIPPKYQGAVVVCQGADNATVRLAISEAVSSLTGLGTDRITIVKMK